MNPFTVLEISEYSSKYDIRKAYKKLALKWHPDKNINNKKQAEKKFKDIIWAYKELTVLNDISIKCSDPFDENDMDFSEIINLGKSYRCNPN